MTKESRARGFLFYGFFCGPEIPWSLSEKSWEEIYRDKVGWPQKPDVRAVPKSEDREQAIHQWAADDFRNFYLMGVQLEYIEPAGEWLVSSEAFLGADTLPHKLEESKLHPAATTACDDKIRDFCALMEIEFQPCSWHLTAIPFG